MKIVVGTAKKRRSWGGEEPYVSPIPPHPDDDWRFNVDISPPQGVVGIDRFRLIRSNVLDR